MPKTTGEASEAAPEDEKTESLPPIPELVPSKSEIKTFKRQFTTALPNKASLGFKTSHKDHEGETISSLDEEEEEDGLLSRLGSKTLKRSSSIQEMPTRSFSEENRAKNKSKESEEIFKRSQKAKARMTNYPKKQVTIPSHKDELFFKYFEAFLEREIERNLKNKNLPTRTRFLSDI